MQSSWITFSRKNQDVNSHTRISVNINSIETVEAFTPSELNKRFTIRFRSGDTMNISEPEYNELLQKIGRQLI